MLEPTAFNPYEAPDRAALVDYFTSFYPDLVQKLYPHVQSVAEEMDGAGYRYMPREVFEEMVDRIEEGYLQAELGISGFGRKKKHRGGCGDDPLRCLIIGLLIGELLKRRKCC